MLVMKFGGTSVGDGPCIRNVRNVVEKAARDHAPVVVVVSALSKVTETLLKTARLSVTGQKSAAEEKLTFLETKHLEAVDSLFSGDRREEMRSHVLSVLAEFRRHCTGMELLEEMPFRAMDAALSVGERLSSTIVARYLDQEGIPAQAVDAAECVVTDENFGSAQLLIEPTRTALRKTLLQLTNAKRVPVMTGFLGATRQGVRTTLGRGGSDYSAAIVAAMLDAGELWIWTDVDGVLSADPKVVENARILDELTYEEAAELSHFGAKVLHHKTLAPLISRKIPVWIKNTFSPDQAGTRIGPSHSGSPVGPKAVSSLSPVTLITLRSEGSLGTTELFARTFNALSHSHVEILMVTQSSYQNSFCILVPTAMADPAAQALEKVFRLELNHSYLNPIERQEVSAVALIGEGMRGTTGIAARVFDALAEKKINIIAIAQGSSESNISLVVDAGDKNDAVRAIHESCIAS